jgi:hypothetical protein
MGLIVLLRDFKLSEQYYLSFEDEGTIIHRNIRNHSPNNTALHLKISECQIIFIFVLRVCESASIKSRSQQPEL